MAAESSSLVAAGGALGRCVGDVEEFERSYWGRRPLIRRGAGPDAFADVWSSTAFDEFLAGSVRRPIVRMVQDGEPVAAEKYTSRVRLGGIDARDVIDPAKVAKVFAAGATVVAQSLHRVQPSVRAFTEALTGEISHPVQANSYLTPPHATGLARHSDLHDVFVLQLEGSKQWLIDGLDDVELHAGDVAYLPAGTGHRASSTASASLHLTIGVIAVTYRSVLERVLRGDVVGLDDPLPLRYASDSSDLETDIAERMKLVAEHLAVVDVREVARAERTRRAAGHLRADRLADAVAATTMTASTVLLTSRSPWTFTAPAGDRVEIRSDGRRLNAPAACRPALEELCRRGRGRVDDLLGLDDVSSATLARRLVAEGLCVPAAD